MYTCANCNRAIGPTETPYAYGQQVICGNCVPRVPNQPPPTYMQPSPYTPPGYPVGYAGSAAADNRGQATAALVLGLVGLIAWLIPCVGLPVTVVGIIMGVKGSRSSARGMARAGLILSIVSAALTVVNAAAGAYMAVQRMH